MTASRDSDLSRDGKLVEPQHAEFSDWEPGGFWRREGQAASGPLIGARCSWVH